MTPYAPIRVGSKRQFDLVAELENVVLNFETKNKLPSLGSAPIRRLKMQLLDAQAANKKTVLVSAVKASDDTVEAAIGYFKRAGVTASSGGDVQIINGLVSLAKWLGELYGEECLGI